MEPSGTERVNEPSSRRETRRPIQGRDRSRKALGESPSSSTPSKGPQKRKRKRESQYWSIKGILDEKKEQGHIFFLIDWVGTDPDTGKPYEQSWEKYENVTSAAITDWANRKAEAGNKVHGNSYTPSSTYGSDPDSPPIRTARRQKHNKGISFSPLAKRPRRAGTAETARFQSVSEDSQEIKDSYEEELSNRSGNGKESGRVRVVLPPIDEDFDRDAYAKLSIQSSQPSQPSQNSPHSNPPTAERIFQSEIFSPPQTSLISQSYAASQAFRVPKARPFLWDEDTAAVVPDSQDLPGSSAFIPSETLTSESGSSGGTDHRYTESISQHFGRNIINEDLEIPSSQPESDSLADAVVNSSKSLSNPSLSIEPSGPSQLLRSSNRPAAQSIQFQGTWSNKAQVSSPKQSSDPESPQFQTQLPIPRPVYLEKPGRHQNRGSNYNPHSDEESQTLAAESHDRHSVLTQRSIYSFEDTWQAAQIVSPEPRPSNGSSPLQDPATIISCEQSKQFVEGIALQTNSPQIPESFIPSQLSPNIADLPCSQNIDKEGQGNSPYKGSVPSHYSSEIPIQSIETSEETSSTPTRPSPLASFGLVEVPSTSRNNLPARETPPEDNMADQVTSSSLSIAEMLKRSRAEAAAATIAKQEAERRASSSIPSTPAPLLPSQMPPLRDPPLDTAVAQNEAAVLQNTIAVPVIVAHPPSSPKSSPEVEPELKIHGLQLLPLGPMEHMVALPMVSGVRDIYDAELINKREHIKALNKGDLDEDGVCQLNSTVDILKKLCDHQDLISEDSATQENLSDTLIAKFAENISTKCQFLAGLLLGLRPVDIHIAILVRPGKMERILEAICQYYEIGDQLKWPLQVTLISTDIAEGNAIGPVSLVVAFDSTFKPGTYSSLRSLGPNRFAPLVRLIINHSVEHLELCLDDTWKSLDRTSALINGAWQIKELGEMGKLNLEEYLEGELAGKAVATYISANNPHGLWPLLAMPGIEGLDIGSEMSSQSEVQPTQPSGQTTQSHSISSPVPPPSIQSGFKRLLRSDEDVSEFSKRQRLTPTPGEQISNNEISQISESVLAQPNGEPSFSINRAGGIGEEVPSSSTSTVGDKGQEIQILALLKEVARLEDQVRIKEAAEVELRQHNRSLEAKCEDLVKSIDIIRPKYQEALNDQGSFQHDRTEALDRENKLRKNYEARTAELATVREAKALIDAELSAAREALSSSTIPEIADFNKLRDELSVAHVENERLQKRMSNMQSEIEYMRGNYQNASSAGADAANEVIGLKEENAILARKASENARRIHEIQASSELRQHLERIDELENQVIELDREIEKKDAELKSLFNGRRATRGTSVPRSPRMGTMSPNVRERRVLGAGVGSRGNSPAPGDAGQPHKGTFGGDALMFGEKPSGRWGNHLQM